MKILITGSEGFIGKNFYEFLSLKHEISTFDTRNLYSRYIRPSQLQVEKYDRVIHLGAISSTTETNVHKLMDYNTSWTIELIEECIRKNVHLQYSSSASVYGNRIEKDGPFKETDRCNPLNYYALSKYLVDVYVENRLSNLNEHPVIQGFRYFNVFGKYEDRKGNQASPYFKFEKQAKEKGYIEIFEGSENYKRDFISVIDVYQYHEKFLNKKVSGIFNIGTGKIKSFFDVAHEVAANFNDIKIVIIPFPTDLKKHYQSYTCADMSIVKNILDIY